MYILQKLEKLSLFMVAFGTGIIASEAIDFLLLTDPIGLSKLKKTGHETKETLKHFRISVGRF